MIWIPAILVAIPLLGMLYQWASTLRDRRRLPPPGRLVGGLHLHEMGDPRGLPVIFEAGIAASAISWQRVQPQAAQFAHTFSYDRAGLGWSAPHRTPRRASVIARELRELLRAAGVPPPYVLCGHSFGGLVVRIYAAMFPGEVAGLVLVDPVNASEWHPLPEARRNMLRRGIHFSRRGATLARLGVVRAALDLMMAGARSLPKAVARVASSGKAAGTTERLVGEVRKLPPETWPAVQAHWCQPKCFLSMADHLESLPASAAELEQWGNLPDIPVVLILAGQNDVPDLTLNARQLERIVAGRSGHWVHLDQPELVVDAIRRVLQSASR